MKKKIFISTMAAVLILILNPFVTKGQSNYEDVVYLKNGGIMHGLIIEQVPNVSLKIQTADRNVFAYKIEEIEKITKEPVIYQQNNIPNNDQGNVQNNAQSEAPGKAPKQVIDKVKQKGVTCIMELNMNRYDFIHNEFSLSGGFRTSVGYLFNPHFSVGGGTGFEILDETCYIPLYTDLRYNITKKAVTPFITADIGYAFRVSQNYNHYHGGLLVNPGLGVKFFVSPKVALNFSLGYLYQEYRYEYYSYGCFGPITYSEKGAYKMFNIKFGVTI
jgi:hypothetical protein